MKAHFFTANAIEGDGELDTLQEKFDVVYTSALLHLFGWDDQLKICKTIIKVLKPQKGSTVFGRQTGNLKGQEVQVEAPVVKAGEVVWRHDVESFTKLWDVAGAETGTRWKTWRMLDVADGMGPGHWAEEGLRRLRFEVVRVE